MSSQDVSSQDVSSQDMANDGLGLSVDMLDVNRLRRIMELAGMVANSLDTAVREIGVLRERVRAAEARAKAAEQRNTDLLDQRAGEAAVRRLTGIETDNQHLAIQLTQAVSLLERLRDGNLSVNWAIHQDEVARWLENPRLLPFIGVRIP